MLTRTDLAGGISLTLQNPVIINQAEELTKQLLELLSTTAPLITLDLEKVDEVDVTFFQIAFALHESLKAQGRRLRFQPLPENHPVLQKAALLGIWLESFFDRVQAPT